MASEREMRVRERDRESAKRNGCFQPAQLEFVEFSATLNFFSILFSTSLKYYYNPQLERNSSTFHLFKLSTEEDGENQREEQRERKMHAQKAKII